MKLSKVASMRKSQVQLVILILLLEVFIRRSESLAPGTPSGVLLNTTSESSMTLTWAVATTGGAPDNFTLAINSSRNPVVISNNGLVIYMYNFTGLTSNTLYSVSVMASNDAGNSNQAVVINSTWALPPGNFMVDVLQGSDEQPSLNVTWTAAIGVIQYLVSELGSVLHVPPERFWCSASACAEIINLMASYSSGRTFTLCIASYNIAGEIGAGTCTTKSATVPGTPSGALLNTTSQSSLVFSWASPTIGGDAVNYTLTINNSRSNVVIPENGSHMYNYTFYGLTSNTWYAVSVMASNDGGNSNQTIMNNCTFAEPPSAINGSCGLQGSIYYLNITWLPAINVTNYQLTCLDLNHEKRSYQRDEHCNAGPCYALIDLTIAAKNWNICIGSYNQGSFLGITNCSNLEIDCMEVLTPCDWKFLAFLIILLLAVPIGIICWHKRRRSHASLKNTSLPNYSSIHAVN